MKAENYGGDLNEGSSRVSYGRLRGKTNAICPPPSDRRLPTVKWEDPEDIKEYFPKTHSMVFCNSHFFDSRFFTCISQIYLVFISFSWFIPLFFYLSDLREVTRC